jgi:hypothetical protein
MRRPILLITILTTSLAASAIGFAGQKPQTVRRQNNVIYRGPGDNLHMREQNQGYEKDRRDYLRRKNKMYRPGQSAT